jgi:arsenite methyltransferase
MSAIEKLHIDLSRLKNQYSQNQSQTENSFAYKWQRRDTYESEEFQTKTKQWLMDRYCGNDPARLNMWLAGASKIILDAGCGAGWSALLFFGNLLNKHEYLGVDISAAVDVARKRFAESNIKGDFLQCSLTDLPLEDESIDIIFSEGVLHHTDSTEESLKYLAKKLKKGGRFLFYVYKKKAVIREFTDDYVREAISQLNNEEAWEALKALTTLGISLGKLNIKVDVEEDIPYLGIKKGNYDLQRFFYWHVCKLYYDENLSFDAMNHINFDWYRPFNCHRHTPEEITRWCEESKLEIEHLDIQDSGITIVAVKKE